jgi:quinol monooxygenase YgiN
VLNVPIYQTAHYQVTADAVDDVVAAIKEFVAYVAANEPGTRMYRAWQQKDDPTSFVHLFEFADDDAHRLHGRSDAVKRFESVYQPVLAAGSVRFTDYVEVAVNSLG